MDRITQIIVLAFIADYFIGDPQNPLHPIRLIGSLISLTIKIYEKLNIKKNFAAFCMGAAASVLVVAASYFIPKYALQIIYGVNYYAGFIMEAAMCYFIIAANALKKESMSIYESLSESDLETARVKLSYIVGRDTENLTEESVIKATIETVAENLSDGVIAPILFIFLGGAPLGLAYKAVNTLDSMIGYRNEKFEYFGKFAAKLDDVVNFIPARVSAAFMILATVFLNCNTGEATRCFTKYRYCHKSPNSAQTEAVCAGALGITLGGSNFYGGVIVEKPEIGAYGSKPTINHIVRVNNIMYLTAVLVIAVMVGISLI